MRVRKRGSVDWWTTSVYTGPSPSNLPNYIGQASWCWAPHWETISDVPGPVKFIKRPFGRVLRAVKPVDHERGSFAAATANHTLRVGSSLYASTNVSDVLTHEMFPNPDYSISAYLLTFAKRAESEARTTGGYYNRYQKCKPTMATRANMFVFLYELRDVKRMFEVLPRKHLRAVLRGPTGIKSIPLNSWKEVLGLRNLNNLHLNYNFGWKPFIADIKAVKKAYDSFDTRLSKFLDNEGLDLRRHWSDTASSINKTYTFGGGSWAWAGNAYVSGTSTESSTFHFRYSLPQYAPDEMRRRAWLDSFGLNLTLANIWRVVPWSFVVDWFYNISKVLDESADDWIQPYVDFIQGCDSVKTELTVKAELYFRSYPDPKSLGTLTYTHYKRILPGIPCVSGQTPSLDADKIRLLASLGASRIL